MTQVEKTALESYYQNDIEILELTAGRILLTPEGDFAGAGAFDENEAFLKAREYFRNVVSQVREKICITHKDKVDEIRRKYGDGAELAGYIATILEGSGITTYGLNYLFIAAWLMKFSIDKICGG